MKFVLISMIFLSSCFTLNSEMNEKAVDSQSNSSLSDELSISEFDQNQTLVKTNDIGGAKGIVIDQFLTSGWLKDINSNSRYHPARAFDSDFKTCWVEGEGLSGEGSYLGIKLKQSVTIDKLEILPGFGDSSFFSKNNRIHKATLIFDSFIKKVEFQDKMEMQPILFEKPISFREFRITIDSVFSEKATWDDTCLSEVVFYFDGTKLPIMYDAQKVENTPVESLKTFEKRPVDIMGKDIIDSMVYEYYEDMKLKKEVEIRYSQDKSFYHIYPYTEYYYNKNGLLEKELEINPESSVGTQTLYSYTEQKKLEKKLKTYTGIENHKRIKEAFISEDLYFYKNNKIEKHQFTENEPKTRTIEYYDEYGNIYWIEYFNFDGEEYQMSDREQIKIEYDAAGRIIKSVSKREMSPGTRITRTFKYDEKGLLIEESELIYRSIGSHSNYKIVYTYDTDGKLIEERTEASHTSFTDIKIYEYNKKGFLQNMFQYTGKITPDKLFNQINYEISNDGFVFEINDKISRVEKYYQYKNVFVK